MLCGLRRSNPTLANRTRKDGAPAVPSPVLGLEPGKILCGLRHSNPTLAHRTRKDGAPAVPSCVLTLIFV